MSEAGLDRQPIEIVEIRFPRCANTFGVAPCTATSATGDGKCYNCLATCQDRPNYRQTPDGHLTPDAAFTQGDTVPSGDIDRTADLFASFEVDFRLATKGIIWVQGSNIGDAVYLGVNNSDELVFRAGDGSVASGAGVGRIVADATSYFGKKVFIYVGINFTPSGASSVSLWVFDPVEITLFLLGTETFTGGTEWSRNNDGRIGVVSGGGTAVGENSSPFTGRIPNAFFYSATSAPDMDNNFRDSVYLGRGDPGEPTNELKIYPCLRNVKAISSKINVNASDDDYVALGRRATLDFSVSDFVSSGIGRDPYLADRETDPRTLSTFWRKELARQKFGKVGAGVFVYNGYAGEAFSTYLKRGYILNRANRDEDGVQFYARDVLTKVEFNKVQVPAVSTGQLAGDVTESATSLAIAGDVTEEYTTTGTVRINDELITYTGRTFTDPETTFTGLTRGTDGSTAAAHEVNDVVQICERVSGEAVQDLLVRWLTINGKIPGQQIDISGIEFEGETYLGAYSSLDGLITEPTGLDKLLGRLSEECSFYIWWDDRTQKIRIKAARSLSPLDVEKTFTDEANILAGSLKLIEKPNQRVNFVNLFYNPRDRAGDLRSPANFANLAQIVNGVDNYDGSLQLREIFALFLNTNAEASQTAGRLVLRYADVPLFATFMVDAKDRDAWVGDYISIQTDDLVLPNGNRDIRRWLIVDAVEPQAGHRVQYTCADVTLDGSIFLISENGVGTYTTALFVDGVSFITNDDGTNIDGTEGAKIS